MSFMKTFKINFKKPKRGILVGVGSLVAVSLVATCAITASAAGNCVTPAEVAVNTTYTNAAPAAAAPFASTYGPLAVSSDANVKVFSPQYHGLEITVNDNGTVYTTFIAPTTACPSTAAILALQISSNGQTIALTTADQMFACLNGKTPDNTIRNWILTPDGNHGWKAETLIDYSQAVTTYPAITADGSEIAFATTANLTPDATTGTNVYAKNIKTSNIVHVSKNVQTGAANTVSYMNMTLSPNGRYVGWSVNPSSYTSRMLPDESGNSVSNLLMADRDHDGDGVLDNSAVKMMLLPSGSPTSGLSSRSGSFLAINDAHGKERVTYNSYYPGVASVTYIYDLNSKKLYKLDTALVTTNADGTLGITSITNPTAFVYRLGEWPAQSSITKISITTNAPTYALAAGSAALLNDRVFLSVYSMQGGGISSLEIPLP